MTMLTIAGFTMLTPEAAEITAPVFLLTPEEPGDRADAEACHVRRARPTYITRFGDVCCRECSMPLAWSRRHVRLGIYGEGTLAWALGQERMHLAALS